MVKHTCLSVFDHFVNLTLKGIRYIIILNKIKPYFLEYGLWLVLYFTVKDINTKPSNDKYPLCIFQLTGTALIFNYLTTLYHRLWQILIFCFIEIFIV